MKTYQESLSDTLMQAKFLLSQAPMMQLDASMLVRSVTPFAYVHPKTFKALARVYTEFGTRVAVVSPSPTRWVLTDLMPEESVIFTHNAIPNFNHREKP